MEMILSNGISYWAEVDSMEIPAMLEEEDKKAREETGKYWHNISTLTRLANKLVERGLLYDKNKKHKITEPIIIHN